MHYCMGLAKNGAVNPQLQDVEENMQRLTNAFITYDHVLLSEENLSVAPFWTSKQQVDNPAKRYWGTIAKTARRFSVTNTKIVLYIRQQDEWASSHWKRSVKIGRERRAFVEYAFNNLYDSLLHYYEFVNTVEQAFCGSCEVIVRLYDRSQFEGGDIFHDFCHAAGIPWDFEFYVSQKERNPSLSFDVAEALRSFHDVAPAKSPLRKERLIPLALSLSQTHPDPPRMTPFSKDANRLLLKTHEEGNKKLAKQFFGREELFPAVDEEHIVWEPNQERIAEYRELFWKECEKDIRHPKLNSIMLYGTRCKNKVMRTMYTIKDKLDTHQPKPRQD